MTKVSILVALILLFAVSIWLSVLRKTEGAAINWRDVHQQIDGFGASSANVANLRAITDAQADMFFDPVKGIGLSLLRTQIQPDGSSTEIVTTQRAVARGVKVWGSPWSPPANYKTNGSLKHGGYLVRSYYGAWASVLAGYVQMMRTKGVPIYAISVQNEPDISENYPSCLYTAQNIHDFVPYLHTAFQSAGVVGTRIMIAEESQWSIDLTATAMADSSIAADISIVAAHGYGGRRILAYRTGSAHLWETEIWGDTGVNHFDGSITEGLIWASKIHEFLTVANVNAWHWWTLTTDDDTNGGLTDLNGNPAKRMYVLGQWAKFVRPASYRIGVSYSGPLEISAFRDPRTGAFAIVVVNLSSKDAPQTFTLNGFSANLVTPWITSAALSLVEQAPVLINGTSFTYTIPASSVTTFSGAALRVE